MNHLSRATRSRRYSRSAIGLNIFLVVIVLSIAFIAKDDRSAWKIATTATFNQGF